MTQQKSAYVYALCTVLFWSTIATASKLVLKKLSPAELVFYASLASCIVLFTVLLWQGKWSVLLETGKRKPLQALGFGVLNPFLYYLALFEAYRLLPAQQAQIINYSWAIALSLLSIPLLGQKIGGLQWLAIAFSYGGVLVIATNGDLLGLHFASLGGVGFALLSTLIWALYWIFNTRDERDPVVGLFLNFLCGLPLVALYLLLFEGFRPLGWVEVGGAIYIGFFEMGVSFLFWLKALKAAENTARIANLIFLSPFLSLVFIHYFVGEPIYNSTMVGLGGVLAGLLLQAFGAKRRQ